MLFIPHIIIIVIIIINVIDIQNIFLRKNEKETKSNILIEGIFVSFKGVGKQ